MNFSPTGDRVLIKKAEVETKTAGGLIIPDTNGKANPTQGEIIALGKVVVEDDLFQVGNTAMFTKCYEVKINNEDYAVVNSEDILGIFKKL
jgi:chaperonin GroES